MNGFGEKKQTKPNKPEWFGLFLLKLKKKKERKKVEKLCLEIHGSE